MSTFLFDASVPVFLRYLARLDNLVAIAEQHSVSQGQDPAELLESRLTPDMAPFHGQVAMAANFSLRACYPLAGKSVPVCEGYALSFEGLHQRIADACVLLNQLNPSDVEGAEMRVLQSQAGQALVSLPATEFLLQYALPNFFFHLTTAYALLRKQGVALGKRDYDGFHSYPLH